MKHEKQGSRGRGVKDSSERQGSKTPEPSNPGILEPYFRTKPTCPMGTTNHENLPPSLTLPLGGGKEGVGVDKRVFRTKPLCAQGAP